MKYTPSALLSELSGTAGSTTASHNRAGPYLRTRTIPTNPNTASQRNSRNSFASAARAWQGLSAGQRTAWAASASLLILVDALGKNYVPSGFQYFMSVNRNTFVYSGSTATILTPPASAIPAALLTLVAAADSGTAVHTLTYTATPLAALTKLVIEATPQMSKGISFIKHGLYRQILVSAAAAASPANIAASYLAKFGALISGKQIAYRVRVVTSDGNVSAPVTTVITVV